MKIIILISIFLSSFAAYAVSFNIEDRILARNYHLDSFPVIFGEKYFSDRNEFKKKLRALPESKQKQALELIKALDKHFPEKLLMPLIYWRLINPSRKNVARVLSYTLLDKTLVLRDYADDPSFEANVETLQLLRKVSRIPELETDKIMKTLLPIFLEKGRILSEIGEDDILIQAILETELFTFDLKEELGQRQVYCLDHYGIIGGNNIELLNYNDTSFSKMEFFNHNTITHGGVLDFKSSLIQIPGNDGGHPSLNEPLFKKIVTMIDSAEDSIFMDIFIMGGTLGATIAEHIVETTKKRLAKNPKFKVVILHDFGSHFDLSDEVLPIFKYIEKERESDKKLAKSLFLLSANTQRHPAGTPFAISNLIPRRADSLEKQKSSVSYTPSKIDHSKILVVDGNTDSPKAWVGSKNLSDNDGGYSFDNAVYIHGPAAALIQHSYYKDLKAALTDDTKEVASFPLKEFNNLKYQDSKDQILESFKITRKAVSFRGSDSIRLTEADVSGTIKNTRNMIIDMIQKAESHIFLEQQFLYDPYIVDALIKRKIQRTQLDIRAIVDHNESLKMGGIPNTVFMRELKSYGIKMRTRKTHVLNAKFPDGSEKTFHQENHRKIISIDGKQLLTGSSNLNPDSLQGTFREFGVQIFNPDQIKNFEAEFLSTWEDPDKIMELDIENYQAIIGGHKMSKSFSKLINGIASLLLRTKDDLEGRD